MVEKLDSIGYGFFIPIFFVMVGVNLEVWSIFKEPSSMLMIPILIVGLFISKLLPSLVLRKWYPRNIVLGSAILLTSTLSLVIAAAQMVKTGDHQSKFICLSYFKRSYYLYFCTYIV